MLRFFQTLSRITATFLLLGLISACSSLGGSWLGDDDEKPLEGERISVLSFSSSLKEDNSLADIPVTLPAVERNTSVLFKHQLHTRHLDIPATLQKASSFSIGSDSATGLHLTTTPVVRDGVMYAVDGRGTLSAITLSSGEKRWELTLPTGEIPGELMRIPFGTDQKLFQGGSLALDRGILFVATGTGTLMALSATDGKEIWQRGMGVPMRSAPITADGKLFIITINNQLFALEATSGRTLWNFEGYQQVTSVLGYPTPAVFENIIIVPFSSGELVALRTDTGKPLWSDSLSLTSPKNSSLVLLSDIDASPIIVDGMLYAVSHEGLMIALDIFSGRRIWEQPVSSINTPWIVGDFLFVMTTNDEMVCLHRKDGRIKWVAPFVSFKDETNKEDKITWSGPVIAGGQVYAVGSHGLMVALSPQTGAVSQTQEVPEGVYQPPLVVDGSLYLIDNEGEISVYR